MYPYLALFRRHNSNFSALYSPYYEANGAQKQFELWPGTEKKRQLR